MKPNAIERPTVDGWFIDGDFTKAEILELLDGLRFSRSNGCVEIITIDRDARDWLVAALRRQ